MFWAIIFVSLHLMEVPTVSSISDKAPLNAKREQSAQFWKNIRLSMTPRRYHYTQVPMRKKIINWSRNCSFVTLLQWNEHGKPDPNPPFNSIIYSWWINDIYLKGKQIWFG